MQRLAVPLLALVGALLAAPAPAHAERFALEYEGAWLGVASLGTARLDMAVGDTLYDATATVKSGGLLRLFEKTDLLAAASGVLTPAGPRWRRYDLDHSYSRKRRVTSLRLSEDDAFRALITPNYRVWGDPPASDADKRASRDPLSSMIAMAMDVARTQRCAGAYPTFDGRFRYDLVLSGGTRANHDRGGYDGPVLKCRMRYVQVAGYDTRNENERRRLPEGEIWFALVPESNVAPPVRVAMPAPVGSAVISLKKWTRAYVTVLEPDIERPATARDP
ncbi:MAG: DUF3108 domain-containing protein [Hyphomonadaceae bacterium]|nr:DUF3108 domain-containing protein [Hyphomonadaceae bacterium]